MSDKKVTPFKDANAVPSEDVVAELEDMLKLAKDGELRSFCFVGSMIGNRTITTFASNDLQEQIGQLSFLHHTLCAKQRENKT